MTPRTRQRRAAPRRALRMLGVAVVTGALAVTLGGPPVAASPTDASGNPGSAGAGSADPPDPYFPALGNRGYDVEHYDVGIRYDPSTGKLRGDTRISARATADLRRFHLDLIGMNVRSVAVDGHRARVQRTASELVVSPRTPVRAGDRFEVRVAYDGRPARTTIPGIGAPNGWIRSDDGALTLNEPDGARTWFPANDHPSDKATFTFRVDVPEQLAAVANGTLRSRTRHGARTTWIWDEAAPMATYLSQLAIGHLALENGDPVAGVAIRHAFAPGVRRAASSAAAATPQMMAFLASWFGPFPFPTYGVLAPDGGLDGLAFEAQTFSVFAPDVFTEPRHASMVLVHEMAHQWFGDWVTPASWQDTWLNEGFATYAEWLWSDAVLGVPLIDNVSAAYRATQAAPALGAADPGREAMFSPAVYERGALTLHALRLRVGDEAFARILRTYLQRFGGANASTDDFVSVATEVAGVDLAAFLTQWLGPGTPPPLPPASSPVGGAAPTALV